MASFTDFLELELLDHVFGNSSYTAPTTLYFGLSTSTITEAGGNITEPSGGAYARKSMTNNTTLFPAAASGATTTGTAIVFATPTASWGTITDFFIADASSGGNILIYGALEEPKIVTSGDTVQFLTGDIDITLD